MSILYTAWDWVILGILFLITELMWPAFVFIWFGVGALIMAVVGGLNHHINFYYTTSSITLYSLAWLIISTLLTFIWFKYFAKRLKNRTIANHDIGNIIGQRGMIIATQTPHHQDLINPHLNHNHSLPEPQRATLQFNVPIFGATEWACRADEPLTVGQTVVVLNILGNELWVKGV